MHTDIEVLSLTSIIFLKRKKKDYYGQKRQKAQR